MDNFPISSNSLEKFYHINGDYFGRQYKEHLSDYQEWDQKEHTKEWMLFAENIGPQLSIDETFAVFLSIKIVASAGIIIIISIFFLRSIVFVGSNTRFN